MAKEMHKERLLELLEKKINHQITNAESTELEEWYEQQLAGGERLFQHPLTAKDQTYAAELYDSIDKEIFQKEKLIRLNKIRYTVGRWAAAAIVVITLGYFLQNNTDESLQIAQETIEAKQVIIHNNKKQTQTIRLADCSIIQLSPASTLTYNSNFGFSNRALQLNGEAYFKVEKQLENKFIVTANSIQTTALGTSFTIQAKSRTSTGIRLHTGKVWVSYKNADSIAGRTMAPGDSLFISSNSGLVEERFIAAKKQVVHSAITKTSAGIWNKTGMNHEFLQESLPMVFKTIEKGFQVTIKYDSSQLSHLYFTGVIKPTDKLSAIMKRLQLLHDLNIESTTTGIVITKK